MTEQRKKLTIEFNYLEMLGLHDYARFKNMNLKDIVLQALEKEIVNDSEYFDSIIEDKKDFLISIIKHDLVEQKTTDKAIEQSKHPDINDDENEAQEESASQDSEGEIVPPVKKWPGKPRFLRDDVPARTVKPKKKIKKKAKASPKTKVKPAQKKASFIDLQTKKVNRAKTQ